MVSPDERHSRLVLILGGARSGKSTLAEQLAADRAARHGDGAGRVIYLATSETNDAEMAARVALHRAQRPVHWLTLECPLDVAAAVREAHTGGSVFLLDCVTFWVSNLLFDAGDLGGTRPEGLGNFAKESIPRDVEDAVVARIGTAVADLLSAVRETRSTLVAVSNEVGLGVVPEYPIGRLYRDELGRANRMLASAADQVFLLVAGIPVELKSLAADPFPPRELVWPAPPGSSSPPPGSPLPPGSPSQPPVLSPPPGSSQPAGSSPPPSSTSPPPGEPVPRSAPSDPAEKESR